MTIRGTITRKTEHELAQLYLGCIAEVLKTRDAMRPVKCS